MNDAYQDFLSAMEPMLFEDLVNNLVGIGAMSPLEGEIRKRCYADDQKPIPISIWTDTELKYLEDFVTEDMCRKWRHDETAARLTAIWRQCGKSMTAFQTLFPQIQRTEEQVACEAMLFFRNNMRCTK